MQLDALVGLAGHGPVPQPQVCRGCERPNTRAMLLDCLHSVCTGCFAAAVSARTLLDCPTCHLPSRTHKRSPHRDYVVDHFLAVSDTGRASHMCTLHTEEQGAVPAEPATFYCSACSAFMCSVCCVEHRRDTSFHTHAPVFLEDLTPEMVHVPVTCATHGDDQLICAFCSTCSLGVCQACTMGDHRTHTLVTADLDTSVYLEVCRKLDAELARPVPPSKLDGVTTTLLTLDELIASGTANVQAQHAVIDEWARTDIDARQARAEELRRGVITKWSVRRKALATQRQDVARRVHAFKHAQSYAAALRRICSAREVLTVGAFVKERLSAFRSWLRHIEPCVSREPMTVMLLDTVVSDTVVSETGVPTLSSVSDPSMRPWEQGQPPSVSGDVRIYVVGGFDEEDCSKVERYDPAEDVWEPVQEFMPTGRQDFACAILGNRLYAIGGYNGQGDTDVVEVFDPASRSWDQACTPLGMPRCFHACVTLGAYIYVIGGVRGFKATVNTVERYDVRTNSWDARTPMTTQRSRLAAVVYGENIYAIGGTTGARACLKSVERYDPNRDCWEVIPPMPVPRLGHAAAVIDGHLYVIGGMISEGDRHSPRVDRFDPARAEWESVTPLGVGRRGLAAVTAGERIYAIGGEKADSTQAVDVETYDPTRNAWTPCKSMPTPRTDLVAAVFEVEERSDGHIETAVEDFYDFISLSLP